jgi:hypothetical protein
MGSPSLSSLQSDNVPALQLPANTAAQSKTEESPEETTEEKETTETTEETTEIKEETTDVTIEETIVILTIDKSKEDSKDSILLAIVTHKVIDIEMKGIFVPENQSAIIVTMALVTDSTTDVNHHDFGTKPHVNEDGS